MRCPRIRATEDALIRIRRFDGVVRVDPYPAQLAVPQYLQQLVLRNTQLGRPQQGLLHDHGLLVREALHIGSPAFEKRCRGALLKEWSLAYPVVRGGSCNGMSDDEQVGSREPLFSQRHGLAPYKTAMQVEALDERARTDIWNLVIYPRYLNIAYPANTGEFIWIHHLGLQRDLYAPNLLAAKLNHIIHKGEWYEVYDLVEFLIRHTRIDKRETLVTIVNRTLALNRAGYRVVGSLIVPITSNEEIASIAEATKSPLENAREHVNRALQLFAERDTPNFAKVIHEAISAAEAAAHVLAGNQGGTLAAALASVQTNNPSMLHPALVEGWKRLYGFTGDSGGIRHALKDGTIQPDQTLAQYFIVTCSAFVNLVAAIS